MYMGLNFKNSHQTRDVVFPLLCEELKRLESKSNIKRNDGRDLQLPS